MSETTEQQALFHFLATMEGRYPIFKFVFHPANEANGGGQTIKLLRNRRIVNVPIEALQNARMGVRKGAWDIWVPFRNRAAIWGYPAGAFVGLAIEMKSKDGRLSEEQEAWRTFLRDEGWGCQVYRSWTDAARALLTWAGGDPDVDILGL